MAKARPKNWEAITKSLHAHEQRGLEFLWTHLPDHEPYQGWSNFEFTGVDGSQNEVDALIVSKQGLFVLELKAHPGRVVAADQIELEIESPEGRRHRLPHPIRLANLKAKRLKELLLREAGKKAREIPYIESLCFLSEIDGFARTIPSHLLAGCVVADAGLREAAHPFHVATDGDWDRPGVMAAILDRSVAGLPLAPRGGGIDKPRKKVIKAAMEAMGFRSIRGGRRIGDYTIEESLVETEIYRDVRARHVSMPSQYRRFRVYFASPKPDAEMARGRIVAAAEREARLLDGLRHEGILQYRELGPQTEEGPSLVFDDTAGFQTLASWISTHRAPDGPEAFRRRLVILRDLAEAVRYAHGQRVVHRGLSPEAVLIESAPSAETAPRSKILNWQSSSRDSDAASATLAATLHPEVYHPTVMSLYAAPELTRHPDRVDETLDIFALGALACLLLTGEPPAETTDALASRLSSEGGLALDELPVEIEPELQRLILEATRPKVSERLDSVRAFLEKLNAIIATLDAPTEEIERIEDAEDGSLLPGGLVVRKRLGKGSTAYGFLVDRERSDGTREALVLKAAIDPDHNDRIDREARAIADADHASIVQLDGEPFDIGASRAFLVKPAGDQTLRDRLSSDGPLELEMLERFGRQLLEAAHHLEVSGIPHRDLKPENIAIVGRESKGALRLVLFDFSLAGVSAENIKAGTPEYLDPFLTERQPRRWDFAADRYSLGLILHEMATGTLPKWGDGITDPLFATGQAIQAVDLMPEGVRESLPRFLAKALQRAPAERWGSVSEMLDAWAEVFRDTQHAPTRDTSESYETIVERLVQLQGPETALLDLPLSTRAANVLDQAGLLTVRQLLERSKSWLIRAKGAGTKTRAELDRLREVLRRQYPEITVVSSAPAARAGDDAQGAPGAAATTPAVGSNREASDPLADLEQAFASLLVEPRKLTAPQVKFVRHYHGLEPADGDPLAPLPTGADVARSLGVTRQRVQQLQEAVRKAWRQHPVVLQLREDLAAQLERSGGLVAMLEAARTLAVSAGASDASDRDLGLARALVLAAVDLERRAETPRYLMYRRQDRQYLAFNEDAVRYAEDLVHAAERLARQDPLPGVVEVRAALAEVPRPEGVPEFSDERLPRLVAAAEPTIARSKKGELYPVGLDGTIAVRLSAATLARLGRPDPADANRQIISRDELIKSVRSRFPEAAPIDDGPRLQEILNDTGWAVRYEPDADLFVTRSLEAVSVQSPGTRLSRHHTRYATNQLDARRLTDADAAAARGFEEAIRQVIDDRGFQVLLVEPRHHDRAVEELIARFKPTGLDAAFDLDASLTRAIDEVIAEKGVDPRTFEQAELAGPEGRHWRNVLQVVEFAVGRVQASLEQDTSPILLTHVGLLGRFGQNGLLERFNATLTGKPSPRACLVLAPADSAASAPVIDGWRVPTLGNQHRPVPLGFLRNLHRAAAG